MIKRTKFYDCIIVGAGPAGIFAALELTKNNNNLSVLILEKGRSLENRICPADINKTACQTCSLCAKTTGWGGAGAFSDGKLNIAETNLDIGITDYITPVNFRRLVKEADQLWVKFGAPQKIYGTDERKIKKIKLLTDKADLDFKVSPIRHLGTENTINVLKKMYIFLNKKVKIKFKSRVKKILIDRGKVKGVLLDDGTKFYSKYIIIAPGREGATWFAGQTAELGLKQINNPVEIGVRVEIPAKVMKDLTDVLYEAKFSYKTRIFADRVRTFCMCPNGFVTVENIDGERRMKSVNGHSFQNRKSENTNFALLVKTDFTYPFTEPNLYGAYITGLANLLSGGILVQRIGDLLAGRRSTLQRIKDGRVKPTLKTAVPGDLAFALPYRHLTGLLEMLKSLDKVAPGVFSFDTLLYGVEVKFFSSSLKLSRYLETEIENLFACGDGAGVSRNLLHASVSGLIVGEEILRKEAK